MGGKVQELLRDPMELAGILRKALGESDSFKQECADLTEKVEKLTDLLCTAARVFSNSRNMYESPAQRIFAEVYKTLDKVYTLVKKCRRRGILKRMVHIISAADFRRASTWLEAAVGDVTWLLNVSAQGQEGRRGGLPPIASSDPMLAWVWEQITLVHGGSSAEKEDGASYLTSLAADNDRNRKLIIEEGGVTPLLKLLKEGTTLKGQLAAASALGTLASNGERARQILDEGAVSVFLHILQDGPMKLKSKVAWVIAKMAAQIPAMQSSYFDEHTIRPLVSLLILESIERRPNTLRSNTMHTVIRNADLVAAQDGGSPIIALKSHNGRHHDKMHIHSNSSDFCFNGKSDGFCRSPETVPKQGIKPRHAHHSRVFSDSSSPYGFSTLELLKRGRENEDPETKRELEVQVVSALWQLAKDNTEICRKITETKALICLAQMMKKDSEEVQRTAVMAVMEIAAAAERDAELRRFAFRTNSRAAKAVLEQLLRIIEVGDTDQSDLQVACLRAVGCLARTFPAKETQVIESLVYQLGNSEHAVAAESAVSLQKFVHQSNFLHVEHSKTILDAGAVHHILHLIGVNGKAVQLSALTLLCYLVKNFPSHDVFLETDTLKSLKALVNTNIVPVQSVKEDTLSAIRHLELYRAAYS